MFISQLLKLPCGLELPNRLCKVRQYAVVVEELANHSRQQWLR
jgi:hypothetical protein